MGLIILDSFLFKKMDLFLLALGLRSYVQTFSSCGERGLLSSCGAWTSGYSGFSCWGALAELTHGMWESPWTRGQTCVPCIDRWILPARPPLCPPTRNS